MARWRRGNAAVCKTAMQRFDSAPSLIKREVTSGKARSRFVRQNSYAIPALPVRSPAIRDEGEHAPQFAIMCIWAYSSAVERFSDKEEVDSPTLSAPTEMENSSSREWRSPRPPPRRALKSPVYIRKKAAG